MRIRAVIVAALLAGAAAPASGAAGKSRDACFAADDGPDDVIASCTFVLGQRKRETTTAVTHALYNRGLAYVKKGDLDRAIADFTESIRLDPSDPDTLRQRGSAYDDRAEYDRALADYDLSIKLDPTNGTTWAYRGIAHSNKGELDEAIRDFDAAIARDPKRALSYLTRALAYEKREDLARALPDIEAAARLDAEDEDIREALKRIRARVKAQPAAGAQASGPATLADLAAQESATAAVWERVPFTTRNAMFVTRKADAYGDYAPRPSSVFGPGEKLLSYIEPVGYAWVAQGDGLRFGVSVDFEIVAKDGAVVGGQKEILRQEFASHYRNREFFLSTTLSFDGAPAGDYVLAYILHDLGSAQTARVEQPFTIKAEAATAQ